MRLTIDRLALSTILALAALPAAAQQCGGSLEDFRAGLVAQAASLGHDAETARRFLAGARLDPKVIEADRRQGVFQLDFTSFARRLISEDRLRRGQSKAREHADTFARIEAEYGIAPGVLLAFWAFETDYGAFQGDFNTLNALVTLAHDCRRPELFRPQILAALELYERGDFDPARTTGAWAGEIGMVQMLPEDILEHGTDGDGDGRVNLTGSAPDALLSGARMLSGLGWRPNQPWLQEVRLPTDFDWSASGLETSKTAQDWAALGVTARQGALTPDLPASVILPQGKGGPAFLAYPNFRVYFEWNQSFTYVLTAAYFATRLEGAPVFDPGNPAPGLDGPEMQRLQQKLQQLGHDVGKIDGILGAGTRAAVRAEQARLGMTVDGWPTMELLRAL